MRRLRTALISGATLVALLVPVHAAAAAPDGATPGGAARPPVPVPPGPAFELGHSRIKAPARKAGSADHTITLRGIDIDGTRVAPLAVLIDLATGAEIGLTESGDTLTGSAPPGDYSLTGIVLTGARDAPRDLALYGDPTLSVHGDVDLTLDARTAAELKAVGPSAAATEIHSHAQLVQTIAGQQITATISGRPEVGLRAWPSAATTRPYHFLYVESQSEPPATRPSPRVYKLAFPTTGRIPAALTFTAAPAGLALVNTTYASQGVASTGAGPHVVIADFDGVTGESLGLTHLASAPGTQRVYYTANGVKWRGDFFYTVGPIQVAERQSALRSFTAGATYSEVWNKAAFGPTMKVGHGQGLLLARPLLGDTGQVGRENLAGNYSTGTTGKLTLFRDGQKVGESDNPLAGDWTVPAEDAAFRLDLTMRRKVAWSNYVTGIDARWGFRSAERPGDPFEDQRRLLQPRITGGFDSAGRAPSGTTFPLDVGVEREVDGSAVTSASLEASFDDGVTWSTVPLTSGGTDRWTARVAHPAAHNGYVALRFKAADGSGNSVEQTVTRAYGLR
ncbi:hypothetical protein AGRA3207_007140 [Actinomadura graeca]|uniref:Uncharacterized protein n=1 Tax=Actinomadura graeca TaxID=2750812 RepID=A0ABX8R3H6_9ACTN|nr:hypothetical protein [Actinomadura graeca]QXJ25620.1 hypothetical protein AGRA3207_007140 [Actinomadura graeca]